MELNKKNNDGEVVKIKIVYDNFTHSADLETNWGFAAVVEKGGSTFLFDTGAHGDILLHNMKNLGVNPSDIDFIVLSHLHSDHTGGLGEFLKEKPNLKVYHPATFPEKIVSQIKELGAESVPVSSSFEIIPGVFTTGEFEGKIPEQALVLKTIEGNVFLTGCAHPGIVKMLETVKSLFNNEPVYLTMGGFHLYKSRLDEIKEIVSKFQELGVERVAPSHCSGSPVRECFHKVYGDNFWEVGAGSIVDVNS